MKSIWNKTMKEFPSEPLTHDITVDTAVIGGGMAGILTTYLYTLSAPQVLEQEWYAARFFSPASLEGRNFPKFFERERVCC